MSLVIELESKKGGRVCDRSYRNGNGCPLIVRQTSEDVLTANVFGVLRRLRPELWLEPMLHAAFPHLRRARPPTTPVVNFWAPVAPPPERTHDEGNTEVDVHVNWGPLCLYVEAKYRAQLSPGTTADASRDQLIRLLDVAYSNEVSGQLFQREPFVLVLGMPEHEPALVTRYRKPTAIREALQGRCRRPRFAEAEFLSRHVGYLSWSALGRLLTKALARNELERALLDDVVGYIRHKRAQLPVLAEFGGGR